jgi:hypothetical protein
MHVGVAPSVPSWRSTTKAAKARGELCDLGRPAHPTNKRDFYGARPLLDAKVLLVCGGVDGSKAPRCALEVSSPLPRRPARQWALADLDPLCAGRVPLICASRRTLAFGRRR